MRLTPVLLKHAEALLAELLRSSFAADSVVSHYFRMHRELGHSDRGFVAENVYAGSFDYLLLILPRLNATPQKLNEGWKDHADWNFGTLA